MTVAIITIRKLLVALERIRDFATDPLPTANTDRDALALIAAMAADAIEDNKEAA